MIINRELLDAAIEVRGRAYVPYSKFAVGAALRTADGRVFAGCNVENISFGLTMCAERVCVGAAVAAGQRDFSEIAIVADTHEPVMPCGACRQVLAELNVEMMIYSSTLTGVATAYRLEDLLPRSQQGILQDGACST
jgi:cytidine deaminase